MKDGERKGGRKGGRGKKQEKVEESVSDWRENGGEVEVLRSPELVCDLTRWW